MELAGDSVQVLVAANLGISLLMAKAIQFLWGVVNSLQLVVLSCLFKLNMPDMVKDLLVRIMQLTNFDLIDV